MELARLGGGGSRVAGTKTGQVIKLRVERQGVARKQSAFRTVLRVPTQEGVLGELHYKMIALVWREGLEGASLEVGDKLRV